MVPFKNLSTYNGNPPGNGEPRKIVVGPLYDLAKIQTLTAIPNSVQLWTAKSRREVANLTMDAADVGGLIRELVNRDYRDSEWCDNGKKAWAACDAYSLTRSEFIPNAGKWFPVAYFLKFAESKTGALVLIVSCHTSN